MPISTSMTSESCSASVALLHARDVVVSAEAARDVARRQRRTFERRDDADHVLRTARRDDDDLELLGREAERLGPQHAARRLAPVPTTSGDTGSP